jgi:hypothetical protein
MSLATDGTRERWAKQVMAGFMARMGGPDGQEDARYTKPTFGEELDD